LDAEFVDTIHTSTGIGYSGDIGHFTIHPNSGGPEQPGCIEDGPDSLGISELLSNSGRNIYKIIE